jgi:hypothetical protein
MRKKPAVKELFELNGQRRLARLFVENIDEA